MKHFNTQDLIVEKPFDLLCSDFQHLQLCNFLSVDALHVYFCFLL